MADAVQSEKSSQCNALTHERLKELLHYDPETGFFTWRITRNGNALAGARAGTPVKFGYLTFCIFGKTYRAHRVAWFYVTGEWPIDEIDHINGDCSDTRFSNLRQANRFQNNWNVGRKRGKSGLKGAFRGKHGRWYSQIKKHGQMYYLGHFDTAEEAHAAYCIKARELFGDFARTK